MTLDAFLTDLQDEGRAAWTIDKYRLAVRQFLTWAEARGGPTRLQPADLKTYLRRYQAPATRRFHAAILRNFLGYLARRKVLTDNIAEGLRTPPVPERPPRVLTDDEEARLLITARAMGLEVELLISLMRFSGLRVGEVVGYRRRVYDPVAGASVAEERPGIRLEDLDLGRRVVQVRGKGGRTAPAYLDAETADLLARHVRGLPRQEPEAPVFQDATGRPRGTRWAGRVFRRLLREAKLQRRLTPHMLRHTFLTRFLEAGGNLRAAQRLARHRRLSSTLIYTDYTVEAALQREFDQHNQRKA